MEIIGVKAFNDAPCTVVDDGLHPISLGFP
jgi:hypothetical protein